MDVENMVNHIIRLHNDAYVIYKPQVEDICSGEASEDEVAHLLDNMFAFCGDEKLLVLFKQVCRKYYKIYPEQIAFQINEYREYYDADKEVSS